MKIPSDYFPIHAHSEFSILDGMGTVEDMVARTAQLGQPGLALTDHGNMAGVLRLYKLCRKEGLAPFPGEEFYVVTDLNDAAAKERRYHLGMVALSYEGFKGLTKLSSRSHTRERFHRRPLVDFNDLSELSLWYGNDVAVTTGCFFGLAIQSYVEHGDQAGKAMIKTLASWFPHTFVEVQKHGIKRDQHGDVELSDWLFDVAHDLSLPVVFGQDSHYCVKEDQNAHDLMKDICYFGDSDDDRFPGGPYHLPPTHVLRRKFTPSEWQRIEEGHAHLLDLNILAIPALDKYKFHVPSFIKSPQKVLEAACFEELKQRGLDKPEYAQRLMYELDVIRQMHMADYFLAVNNISQWCKAWNIVVNARGSVNGSLVAYLLDITTIDPLEWDTSFDRFLSVARKKPPDIDLDVESTRRADLLAHMRHTFPGMVHIGTYGRIGITEQDDGSGMLEDKGSVFVQYAAAMRRKNGGYNGIKPEHRGPLNRLADLNVRKSFGVHAAGLVLPTRDHKVEDFLATGLVASSNTTATQAVMEDVEDLGFMKMDILGVRSLATLSQTLTNIGQTGWDWLPWDDKLTCKVLSSGYCVGIFQFEGASTARGGKEMQIKNTMDAVVCLALYRPALMHGGQKDRYLDNRRNRKNRPYKLDPFFDPILDITFGVPVFQEQVMQMCTSVGMAFEDWNELMKAVKASNDKINQYAIQIMSRIRPLFIKLCKQYMSAHEAQQAWDAIAGFTDYGFNRAHATSYGVMAYRSAYLKTHYPTEYMHALLSTWIGTDKERMYMSEARRHTKIGRPDVQKSGVSWVIEPPSATFAAPILRRGLQSIKGIGNAAAQAIVDARDAIGGSFASMDELVATVPARPVSGGKSWTKDGSLNGVLEKLRQVGALESLGVLS